MRKYTYLKKNRYTGQAMIAILLVLALAIIFINTAAVIYLTETDFSFNSRKSNEIYYNTESGLENAILQLLRQPNYSGESLTFDDSNVTINVTAGPGGNQKTITATGKSNSNKFIRILTSIVEINNRLLNLVSWRENE